MDLTDLQMTIISPFIDETIKTLDTMCGLHSYAGDPFQDQVENFRFKGYAVAAKTHGKIEGVILLHNYIETAVSIGNELRFKLLEETKKYEDINEDMQGALAEWGNTAIGRATRYLSERNMGITFEPPYFITNTETMDPLLVNANEIISIPIHVTDVGRFYFNYIINKAGDKKEVTKSGAIPKDGKILVVDDSNFIRIAIKKCLKKVGYENTIEAGNGQEAVDKYKSEKPDMIFMDYVMPQLSGYEALKKIRSIDKDVPIVMFTSVADQKVIDECSALGITGYVVKPLTAETGPDKLKKFLDNPKG